MTHFIYRDSNGKLRGFDSHEEAMIHGGPELVRVVGEELEAIINPPQTPMTREQVLNARLSAYADPITGSDRFKIEADAERLTGDEEAAKASEQKWLARRAEIAAELPWPVE